MPQDLTQLGLGGLVALMILREVLAFLSRKRHTNGNGASKASVEPKDALQFWELQQDIRRNTQRILEILERRGAA